MFFLCGIELRTGRLLHAGERFREDNQAYAEAVIKEILRIGPTALITGPGSNLAGPGDDMYVPLGETSSFVPLQGVNVYTDIGDCKSDWIQLYQGPPRNTEKSQRQFIPLGHSTATQIFNALRA